jgi:hypothetical protein
MRKKQNYIAPTAKAFGFEAELMLTTSNVNVYDREENGVGGGEEGEYGDAVMNNKKDPWSYTWE